MLLIGDIHLTSKRTEQITAHLRAYFSLHTDREVVFLGDFVYHFNYDRKALLSIYEIFLELYKEGRTVIVLAGNHDWLQNSFVFEEAKKAFDLFVDHSVAAPHGGAIHFVTEPKFLYCSGRECLFFPFHIPKDIEYSCTHFDDLIRSDHQQEQWSGRANSLLSDMIQDRKARKGIRAYLPVFHHRYIAGQAFPGQFAKFGYKNPALSNEFLDDPELRLISGHLHQPFCYKNYLCLGSIWHTSPLEINQCKFLYRWDVESDVVSAEPIYTNPYIRFEQPKQILNDDVLEYICEEQYEEQGSHLTNGNRNITIGARKKIPLQILSLTLISDAGYNEIDTILEPSLRESLKDTKLRQQTKSLPALVELLDTSSKELDTRLGDWKKLLSQFLEQKYSDDSDIYIQILHDLEIV